MKLKCFVNILMENSVHRKCDSNLTDWLKVKSYLLELMQAYAQIKGLKSEFVIYGCYFLFTTIWV